MTKMAVLGRGSMKDKQKVQMFVHYYLSRLLIVFERIIPVASAKDRS
jgi:hypothetical protein